MSVFETTWSPKLDRDGAVKLCSDAIMAGIFNDLGSGSNVDVCVITNEKATLMRNYITPNVRVPKALSYKFERGTTAYLQEKVMSRNEFRRFVTVQELGVETKGDTDAAEQEAMVIDP